MFVLILIIRRRNYLKQIKIVRKECTKRSVKLKKILYPEMFKTISLKKIMKTRTNSITGNLIGKKP